MKLGIIGPPQSGKTTLFNAVSGKMEAVGDYSRAVHRAIIKVPDERLDNLTTTLVSTKKITHAEIEFLDAAGFTGKGKKAGGDTDIMPDLRLMDALVIVVDQYSQEASPEADLQAILDEMILADMMVIENNVDKLERTLKLTGKNERARELEILKQCRTALENETPLSEIGLTLEDKKEVRGYAFLTLKPVLITFNISEDLLPKYNSIYEGHKKYCLESIRDISVICGKIEMELAALEIEERKEFLKELNIERPAVEKFIQKSYNLLGLISFFTIGEPECRAWTIKKG
ncbi:MAG: GTPase, partial [Candidatus Zixiibacteriota bacterium]